MAVFQRKRAVAQRVKDRLRYKETHMTAFNEEPTRDQFCCTGEEPAQIEELFFCYA